MEVNTYLLEWYVGIGLLVHCWLLACAMIYLREREEHWKAIATVFFGLASTINYIVLIVTYKLYIFK